MRLLLVDNSGVFRRQYHATQHEERGEAMRRTLRQVRTAAPDYDRVVICCDSRKSSWRKDLDPSYKAQRDKPDELLYEEMRATTEALGRDGFHVVESEGFEADDVIASLVWHLSDEHALDIMSDDKDMAQLVSDERYVAVVKSDGFRYDEEAVEAKFGVSPPEMPQWQALVGDAADNIPGVKGIGPKRATALLNYYGLLPEVVQAAHDGEVKGAAADAIKAADADGSLARGLKLVTLRNDALNEEQALLVLEEKQVETETEQDFEEDDMGADISEQLAVAEAVPEPAPSQPAESGPGLSGAMVPYQEQGSAMWQRGLEPRNMSEAKQLAKYVLDSRLFSSYGTPQAALLVIMSGRELGIGAMSSLRSFHIVEGKPTMSAQLIKGLCQSSPQCEYFMLVEATTRAATFETKRKGEPQPTRMTYSIEDAEAAGLLGKKNWRSYPRPMLMNRCIAELGRMVYPDVVANLYTPDELGADVPEEVAA